MRKLTVRRNSKIHTISESYIILSSSARTMSNAQGSQSRSFATVSIPNESKDEEKAI